MPILLLFLFITTCFAQQDEAKLVETVTTKKSEIIQTVRLIGTIMPRHFATFVARVGGTLDHVIPSGTLAKKGDVIARLENTDLEATVKLAENAQKLAEESYERIVTLSRTNLTSKEEISTRLNALIEARKTLAASRIARDQTVYTAPFDGLVGTYKIREGAQVQVGAAVVTFYKPDDLVIEFDIPEHIVGTITPNQQVYINDKVYTLTHAQKLIDPETHMSPAVMDYDCIDCVVGSNIYVDLVTAHKKDVIVIPAESVFIREGKSHVYVVEKDEATLKPVTPGVRSKDKIEITEGLNEGELVIWCGQGQLYPTAKVKIHKEEGSK